MEVAPKPIEGSNPGDLATTYVQKFQEKIPHTTEQEKIVTEEGVFFVDTYFGEDGKLLGTLRYFSDGKVVTVSGAVVEEGYRDRGIGTLMYANLIKRSSASPIIIGNLEKDNLDAYLIARDEELDPVAAFYRTPQGKMFSRFGIMNAEVEELPDKVRVISKLQ